MAPEAEPESKELPTLQTRAVDGEQDSTGGGAATPPPEEPTWIRSEPAQVEDAAAGPVIEDDRSAGAAAASCGLRAAIPVPAIPETRGQQCQLGLSEAAPEPVMAAPAATAAGLSASPPISDPLPSAATAAALAAALQSAGLLLPSVRGVGAMGMPPVAGDVSRSSPGSAIGVTIGERLRWSPELHTHFAACVEKLGGPANATPKEIVDMMNVPGITINHVKSHLQKHRLQVLGHKKGATGVRRRPADGALDNGALSNGAGAARASISGSDESEGSPPHQEHYQDAKRQRLAYSAGALSHPLPSGDPLQGLAELALESQQMSAGGNGCLEVAGSDGLPASSPLDTLRVLAGSDTSADGRAFRAQPQQPDQKEVPAPQQQQSSSLLAGLAALARTMSAPLLQDSTKIQALLSLLGGGSNSSGSSAAALLSGDATAQAAAALLHQELGSVAVMQWEIQARLDAIAAQQASLRPLLARYLSAAEGLAASPLLELLTGRLRATAAPAPQPQPTTTVSGPAPTPATFSALPAPAISTAFAPGGGDLLSQLQQLQQLLAVQPLSEFASVAAQQCATAPTTI